MEAQANVREANWLARRLVARSPLAEPAMTAAAALVLLRALALEAEAAGGRRRPNVPPSPPSPRVLDGTRLGEVARPLLGGGRVMAAVRSGPTGRLDRVEVAIGSRLGGEGVRRAVSEPARWRALPGWREIKPLPGARWEVDSRFPFVDFDATWAITARPFRGQVVGGDARGAVMAWDILDGAPTVAVYSLHPRLETAGYIPRKFIEAEPLLEHGLSLGLAYVNGVSLLRALLPRGP
jgi:hypothetical protein